MRAMTAYRKSAVQTSDPRELVVMLYDGFLRFSFRTRTCLMKNDSNEATKSVGKALAIVHELTSSLNHEPAPEFSRQLESLYMYISERLMRVSLRQDLDALDEVIGLMSELREGWAGALDKVRREDGA